jgi:hypothetical protein
MKFPCETEANHRWAFCIVTGFPVPQFNKTAELEVAARGDRDWEALNALNPGLGAYINEVS